MPAINLRATKGGRNMTPITNKQKLHSVGRLLKYVFKYYPLQFAVVLICILFSSGAGTVGSYIVGNVIVDAYLNPAIAQGSSLAEYVPVAGITNGLHFSTVILILVCVYLLGLICSFVYNVMMSIIGQGIQKRIRDELFDHLQSLPVSYFDRRGHGDIMSIFTNDVDALREMLSRALPMVASSIMTMVVCFVFMLLTDLLLTGIVLGFSILILFITSFYAKRSRKYFIRQQIELGTTNGYIEEMTNGQKVVKVFNYEDRNIAEFRKHKMKRYLKIQLRPNRFANVLMPTVNQLSPTFKYALLALIGGHGIVNKVTGVSFNGLSSVFDVGINRLRFLMFSKSFTQPIGQVSQQLNVIALALAGSTRIFEVYWISLSETDDGYVELVNAKSRCRRQILLSALKELGIGLWETPSQRTAAPNHLCLAGKARSPSINVEFCIYPWQNRPA